MSIEEASGEMASETQLRHVVDAVEEYAVCMLDSEGHVQTWNEGARKITGYEHEEIVGKHVSIFYTADDRSRERPAELLDAAAREGTAETTGWRMRKDGSKFWVRDVLRAHVDEEGQVRGFLLVTRDMTNRRARDKKVWEEEQRYRRLFRDAQEGIGITTPEGRIIDVNPAAEDILGYSREELLYMNVKELYVDPDKREEGLEQFIEQGGVSSAELRLQRKDGAEIVCRLSSTVHRAPDGQVKTFQTFFRDVTEEKWAQKAVRESEERYRRLFEESRDAILLTTSEGVIVDVNGSAETLFGYTREELLSLQAKHLYADPAERSTRIIPEIDQGSGSRILHARMRRKDGDIFLASAAVTVHRNQEGHAELIQALVRDVTEQERVQKALEESERKFRQLAEQSIMGIVLAQDDLYRYANPRMAEMFGYETRELVNERGPKDLMHPDDWPHIQETVRERLSDGDAPMQYNARGVRKDGEVLHLQVYETRITSGGEPATLCYLLDMTERRQLQREILHIQEEERQRMGQDLHDGVSSQLTGVHMILSSIIQRAENENIPIASDLERVRELIKDSSEDIRRISRGLSPLELHETDFSAALKRLAENTSTSGGAACHCRVENGLPPGREEQATHLYWIVQEAVTNARKYSGATSIEIQLERDDPHIVLSVADDGDGFDLSEDKKRGLGLRTMRYRAELIGGTFTIDTAPGEGTTVECRLPLRP